jgi:hypothetical protein
MIGIWHRGKAFCVGGMTEAKRAVREEGRGMLDDALENEAGDTRGRRVDTVDTRPLVKKALIVEQRNN